MLDDIVTKALLGIGSTILGRVVLPGLGTAWQALRSPKGSPLSQIRDSAAKSTRFDMLTTWSYDMPDFAKTIRSIVEGHHAKVRILLLSPTSPFLQARAEALEYSGDVAAQVRANIEDIRHLMRTLPAGHLEACLYDRLPTVAMFGTDEHVIATWLLEKMHFRDSPATILKRTDKTAKPLIDHFESIWRLPKNQIISGDEPSSRKALCSQLPGGAAGCSAALPRRSDEESFL